MEEFDPDTVPTVSELINEIGAYDDANKDSKGILLSSSLLPILNLPIFFFSFFSQGLQKDTTGTNHFLLQTTVFETTACRVSCFSSEARELKFSNGFLRVYLYKVVVFIVSIYENSRRPIIKQVLLRQTLTSSIC